MINKAVFKCSSEKLSQVPKDALADIAFIGRSNVGKSSLINMLTGRKGLAMTSSTPGKTMLINHFIINGEWFLVDLPGYGYAKRSKKDTEALGRMIRYYVTERSQLTCLFVLVDSRHTPQKIDLDFITMLGEEGVPFGIIFTKADKSSGSKVAQNVKAFRQKLLETWEEMPPYFITSSENGKGREEVLGYIEEVMKQIIEE